MADEGTIGHRRTREAKLLSVKGFMNMGDLAQEIGVSESTIRRDLEMLEQQGLIKRTYGGAVFIKDSSPQKLAFAERETTAVAEKQAIALAVAGLIPENQTLILDGGTTCSEIARALLGRRLCVVTNSVPIAALLSGSVDCEVTLVGGYVYPRTGVALGSAAVEQLRGLHATQLVLSCAGVTSEGAFNINQMMVDVERQMMAVADQVILAVDHTKLGRRAVAELCDLDEVDVLVTDPGMDAETRGWLESLDVGIVLAEPVAPPSSAWRAGP